MGEELRWGRSACFSIMRACATCHVQDLACETQYQHLSGKPGKYLQQSHTPQCLLVLLTVFYLRFVIFRQLLIVLVTRTAEFREALPISGAYSSVVGGMKGS